MRRAREIVEEVGAHRHVDGARLAVGLPRVECLEAGELVGAGHDPVADLPEDRAALRGAHRAPRAVERAPRGADGAVDVLGTALGNARYHGAVRGVSVLERLP